MHFYKCILIGINYLLEIVIQTSTSSVYKMFTSLYPSDLHRYFHLITTLLNCQVEIITPSKIWVSLIEICFFHSKWYVVALYIFYINVLYKPTINVYKSRIKQNLNNMQLSHIHIHLWQIIFLIHDMALKLCVNR